MRTGYADVLNLAAKNYRHTGGALFAIEATRSSPGVCFMPPKGAKKSGLTASSQFSPREVHCASREREREIEREVVRGQDE